MSVSDPPARSGVSAALHCQLPQLSLRRQAAPTARRSGNQPVRRCAERTFFASESNPNRSELRRREAALLQAGVKPATTRPAGHESAMVTIRPRHPAEPQQSATRRAGPTGSPVRWVRPVRVLASTYAHKRQQLGVSPNESPFTTRHEGDASRRMAATRAGVACPPPFTAECHELPAAASGRTAAQRERQVRRCAGRSHLHELPTRSLPSMPATPRSPRAQRSLPTRIGARDERARHQNPNTRRVEGAREPTSRTGPDDEHHHQARTSTRRRPTTNSRSDNANPRRTSTGSTLALSALPVVPRFG